MGHDNVRATIIYQHATSGADQAIAKALGEQLAGRTPAPEAPASGEETADDDDEDDPDDGATGVLAPTG
jgi:hypothetical protein